RTRAGQEIAVRVVGVAHAHVPEGVEHAFIGDNAVGNRQFAAGGIEIGGQGFFLLRGCWFEAPRYRRSTAWGKARSCLAVRYAARAGAGGMLDRIVRLARLRA